MKKLFIFYILYFGFSAQAAFVDINANHFYANDIKKVAFFEGDATIKQANND